MSETSRMNDAMRKRLTKLSIEAIDYWRDRAERAEARVAELERELADAASCAGMGGGKTEADQMMVCPGGDGKGNCKKWQASCENAKPHKRDTSCNSDGGAGRCPRCIPVDGVGEEKVKD